MKNKEFHKLLKKNRSKSNSGFTLTELLIGLVMGTIVVGALGLGLTQMLRTTGGAASKSKTRSETARAFSFIADEVKAAQAIEVDSSTGTLNTVDDPATPGDESIAPSFTPPAGGTPRLALQVPGVSERIIYSVAPAPAGAAWNGPQVIYRWGPNFSDTGGYSDPNNTANWINEALIDGVDNTDQTITCDVNGDGTAETITYQGFYACVVDDDGDGGTVENLTDTNGDGKIDSADGADINGDGEVNADDGADTDGTSITAQIYFVGQSDTGIHQTDSQVVARSRVAPLRKPELQEPEPVFFTSLNPQFGLPGCWTVRNDFGAGSDSRALPGTTDALENVMTWVHENNRQPQPLNIDKSKPFTMVGSAFGGASDSCLAKGNRYKREWDETTSQYQYINPNPDDDDDTDDIFIIQADGETDEDFKARLKIEGVATDGLELVNTYKEQVSHTIDFQDEATYNGVDGTDNDNPDVAGDGSIYMFRNDSNVPEIGGYDADNDGNPDQDSLRKTLFDKGYVDSNGDVIPGKLEPNQRIVVFELGQDKPGENDVNPGYDLQDSMFIMTFDDFAFTP